MTSISIHFVVMAENDARRRKLCLIGWQVYNLPTAQIGLRAMLNYWSTSVYKYRKALETTSDGTVTFVRC